MRGIDPESQMRFFTNSISNQASVNSLTRQLTVPREMPSSRLSTLDEIIDFANELFGVKGRTFGDIEVGHTCDLRPLRA
ncbi:hypothetical protein IFM89_020311 [Coptis chinensis]|uniref:Uncharacterized protein n=1 Tax=Coptis chinensis TaxID=261450 RepID=A0A835HKW7_9MAGN|nr:hypothetical protein IFM89_020311 [Coptis chinensis]